MPLGVIVEDLVGLLYLVKLFGFLLLHRFIVVFDFIRMTGQDEFSMSTSYGGQRSVFGHIESFVRVWRQWRLHSTVGVEPEMEGRKIQILAKTESYMIKLSLLEVQNPKMGRHALVL